MKQSMIAIHTVIYGKGLKALPGEEFDVDSSSVESLLNTGAAKLPEEVKKAGKSDKKASAKKDKPPKDKDGAFNEDPPPPLPDPVEL